MRVVVTGATGLTGSTLPVCCPRGVVVALSRNRGRGRSAGLGNSAPGDRQSCRHCNTDEGGDPWCGSPTPRRGRQPGADPRRDSSRVPRPVPAHPARAGSSQNASTRTQRASGLSAPIGRGHPVTLSRNRSTPRHDPGRLHPTSTRRQQPPQPAAGGRGPNIRRSGATPDQSRR